MQLSRITVVLAKFLCHAMVMYEYSRRNNPYIKKKLIKNCLLLNFIVSLSSKMSFDCEISFRIRKDYRS